jgi:NADH-quinone oxidoreductase subunit J
MFYCLFSAAPTMAEFWPIVPPLLAGAAALYFLLPRPKSYPVSWGAGMGLLALILSGWFLMRGVGISLETIFFWSFSLMGAVSAVLLVTQHNPARAALAFALVVLSTCGLFLLLAAPFLMAATIIIYAGAIIVTFLFVIMLAQQHGLSDADDRSREPGLATFTGFLLLGTLLLVLMHYSNRVQESSQAIDRLIERTREVSALNTRKAMDEKIGEAGEEDELFKQFNQIFDSRSDWQDLKQQVRRVALAWSSIEPLDPKAVEVSRERLSELIALGETARHRLAWLPAATETPLSDLSGAAPVRESERVRRDSSGLPRMPADNAAYLGRSLFTDFLLPVELGGTLLLAATVGAIAIAFRRS